MILDNDVHRYDDIIDMPHHTSTKHPQMSLYDRAAQFAPFAALTGHDMAIKETARVTDKKVELDEYAKEKLNDKLQIIRDTIHSNTEVTITYFVPDEKKAGGAYHSFAGCVKKLMNLNTR